MGLMDKLFSGSSGAFIGGFADARIDRWENKAMQIQKEADRAGAITDQMEVYKQKTKFDDDELARKNDAIAVKTYNSALAEIGNEDFVEKLKTEGKLNTPQLYNAWKNIWINYSGNPIIFKNTEFQNDWITSGGKINNNKEDNAVNNLTSGDGPLKGQKATGESMIKTKSMPSGVNIQETPEADRRTDGEEWTLKWAKTTATAQPKEPKYLFDKTNNIARDVTVAERLKEPDRFRPVADPEKVTTDLTPFGDSTIYAGIYTVSDKPGQYFTNLQIDPANAETFLQENKGFTVDSLGYVRDENNKTIPTNVALNEIRDLEAIDKMDSYQMFDPNDKTQRAMLESFGIAKPVLDNYAKTNKIVQYEIEYVGGVARTSGEPKVIDISIANQKFDTTRGVIEKGITAEMAKYFPSENIIFDANNTAIGFKFKSGSLLKGKENFFNAKTAQLLNVAIKNNIAPSAKNITQETNQLAENYNMLVAVTPFTNNASKDALTFANAAGNSMMGMELLQSYLAHYGDTNNLTKAKPYWLNENETRTDADLATHVSTVAEELYKIIQINKRNKYLEQQGN